MNFPVLGFAIVTASFAGATLMQPVLPEENTAKSVLNATHRHREWVNVQAASAPIRVFIVYPERSNLAPVVLLSADRQGAGDWIRAVADQTAAAGFIAVVPDVLSGLGPGGGDTDSFAGPDAIAAAAARMSRSESARRMEAARRYAIALPAANGRSATLSFGSGHVDAFAAGRRATFPLSQSAFSEALGFLTRQTHDHPFFAAYMPGAEDHSAHFAMLPQAASPQAAAGGPPAVPYPMGKLADLPAGIFTAKSTLLHSKLQKEFIDIPVGNVKLHTWIEYPAGNGKAPVVLVMQHGPGLDDWQRALADQLAMEGFIAIAPDLFSGMGPHGGNYDSFEGPDDVLRSNAKLSQDEGIRRYKAAFEYGRKLPRASGKTATVGFCAGGGYSFRFAGEVPEIDAAVVFYGTQPNEGIMSRIKAPVLGFYGEDDARVTATVEPAAAAMKKLGKSFETHIYPHGTHGFLEYQDVGGNPQATADSWHRTIGFLKQHTS
ncbi:MAG TPA: dienelactone hydrolase family protein [Bryobacteraceae bacterium]|nr:dienelactone hydrolase family protein [Bryobacteraceae bacterium]